MTDYTGLIARLRSAYVTASPDEAADALEEIAASREAVWKHAKMLEKDLLAHKERIVELEAALEPFALQTLSTEMQMVNAVYLTPIGELDRQAREIKRRDDEIRAARAALEKKND